MRVTSRRVRCRQGALLLAVLAPFFAASRPGSNARTTEINGPTDLASDGSGRLFIAEQVGKRLLQLDLRRRALRPISIGRSDTYAHAVATDHKGGLYVADFGGGLQHLDLATGARQVLVDSTSGSLDDFNAMVVDERGNLYLSQGRNHTVLVWNASSKQFSTLAGAGKAGFSGDGGPAEKALLHFPRGLALTPEGDLLIADTANCRIRKVERASGVITTIAGTGAGAEIDECTVGGDGGPALQAQLAPSRIAVDKSGAIFTTGGSHRVRRIDPATRLITTVAGTGKNKSSGDRGPASRASFASPAGIAVDAEGNIYVSEYVGNRVRRIDAATGIITTVAGNGLPLRADLIL
jgi:sugar lactone lactonase YvrE